MKGIKVGLSRNLQPHERRAYSALRAAGYDPVVLPVDSKARAKGRSSPDVLLEGEIWELKCPQGTNRQKTVSRNINKAVRQLNIQEENLRRRASVAKVFLANHKKEAAVVWPLF